MFLGAYHFDGEPPALLAGYDRLVAQFPPGAIDLNVCVARDHGDHRLRRLPVARRVRGVLAGARPRRGRRRRASRARGSSTAGRRARRTVLRQPVIPVSTRGDELAARRHRARPSWSAAAR